MQNQLLFSSDSGGRMLLKSYPKAIACEESMGLYASKDFLMSQQTCHQRKYFAPHWSVESVNEALEKGNVFKALFCVNAHNRLEAYCKIDGVQTDVLISGIAAQNRAVSLGEYLFPMADIVTPNLKEASALLGGVQLETVDDMRSTAKSIHDMGPRNVLVKGGDLASSLDAVDIFFDGDNFYELRSPRIRTRNTHGTGCTLTSCIAAELAKGSLMLSAVKVVHVVKSDSRLANNDLPVDIQSVAECLCDVMLPLAATFSGVHKNAAYTNFTTFLKRHKLTATAASSTFGGKRH
ncbi:hypothetical protein HYC85_001690 [Camellia sinensis]|uniref:Pyridoxamine kinase/Phosphomethylpyrimidine kinase domain-containing protein n=1 Tax=Camellia sinensis TaxID=4442 RepID=A0A7J7I7D4_CAMSI|nr:hypothetical protein HYC85_001690 [Camellia sinensis]